MSGSTISTQGPPAPAPAPAQGSAENARADLASRVTLALQEVCDILARYQESLKGTSGGAPDGVTDANGAPVVSDGPDMSGDEIALAIMNLSSKMLESALAPLQKRLEMNKVKQQQLTDLYCKKVLESLQKAREAQAKSKTNSVLGWVSKITGGLVQAGALQMLVANSTMGIVPAAIISYALITAICNGDIDDISDVKVNELLQNGLEDMFAPLCKELGLDPDTAQHAAMITAGVWGISSHAVVVDSAFASQLGAGAALAAGADQQQAQIVALSFMVACAVVLMVAGGASWRNATDIQKAAMLAQTAATVVQATVALEKGFNDLELAQLRKEMGLIDNETARIDACIALVTRLIQENQDVMKPLIESAQAKAEMATDILKASQSVQSHIAHAI